MTLAEKLTEVANNRPKLYKKGALDYSPQETVSGEAIGITDISPIEHNMGVSVRKMNLLKYPYVGTLGGTSTGLTITDNGDGTLTINGTETDSTKYKSFFFMDKELHDYLIDGLKYYGGIEKPDSTLAGQIYILVKNNATGANEWLSGNSFTVNKSKYTYSRIYVQINGSSSVFENTVFKPYLTLYDTKKYAPYIEDISTVKLYKQGKNWFNEKAITKKTEKTIEVDGVSYEVYDINGYTNDYLYTTNSSFRFDVYMKKGKDYTVSLIWMGSSDKKNQAGSLYMPFKDVKGGNQCFDNRGAGSDVLNAFGVFGASKNPLTKITFRITPTEDIVKGALCYYSYGVKGYVLKDSIQIEEVTDTEYEPYIEPTIYDVPTDGIVKGVTSLYPNTTLYTDTSGAVIDCTYYQDGRKVKENLTDMILSLGGVINE